MFLTIANSAFDDLPLQDGGYTVAQPIPGWQVYDPSGLFTAPNVGSNYATLNPQTLSYANEASLGNVSASYLENPIGSGIAGLSQTLTDVLTVGNTYTLRAEIGNPLPDAALGAGFPGYVVQLVAGGKILAEDRNTRVVPEGAFVTSTVSYTPLTNDPSLGQPLEIRLLNPLLDIGREVDFNQISLEANPTVANGGFEEPVLADGGYSSRTVPGWQIYDPFNLLGTNANSNLGSLNPSAMAYPGQATEGNNVLATYFENPTGSGIAGVSQTLGQALKANTTYRLSVDIGNNALDGVDFPGYAVQLLAGNRVIAQDVNTIRPAIGTFAPVSVTYTSSANDGYVGQPLQIRLLNLLQTPGPEVNFDNVRLDSYAPVANAGFEDVSVEDGTFISFNVPGWQLYDPNNLLTINPDSSYSTLNPNQVSYPGEAPEGNNVLDTFIENPPGSGPVGLSQTLNRVLTADTTYSLAVNVGNALADEFSEPGFPGYAVQLLAGSKVIAQDNYFPPADPLFGAADEGVFTTSTVTYSALANDANLGQPLSIRLINKVAAPGKEVNFDNVRLTETKLPTNFFNEAYYLQNNTDIAGAVGAGLIASGLEHFNRFGLNEGRTEVSLYYDEASYLQRYTDVAGAVGVGIYASGLDHFLEIGYNEGRYGAGAIAQTGDRQADYLGRNTDVAQYVTAGIFKSAYDHFVQFGTFEGRFF
ncbi:hypothetical protein [Argonema antarcticum]|uniref:hypothetical protein n=1 Tax=Argonema antarcticum TaxID=2942763 RepID=UPI002011AEC1|nr:hypothetical protein [Argonema antarcticum]MCL1469406.1 hypothetical protein [Argonema antarcticum A004/B2]